MTDEDRAMIRELILAIRELSQALKPGDGGSQWMGPPRGEVGGAWSGGHGRSS